MIEKVNPCHPDKVADRIAGALMDYAYSVQSCPRIAVEVLIGHRICHIIAEEPPGRFKAIHIECDMFDGHLRHSFFNIAYCIVFS